MKRLIEIIITSILITVLLPLLLIVILLIKWKIGSPVFFIQKRPGLYEKPFYLLKFRTMIDSKDKHGNFLPDGLRLLPFGKLLRKYSIDELPQLFNVLKGDISLVGPRPLLMEYLPLYTKEQARRHNVKPGITGWAQINGRNAITWEEKFKLDLWYVENHSFLLDMKILFLTIKKVIRREGINYEGHVTIEKFTGSDRKEGVQ